MTAWSEDVNYLQGDRVFVFMPATKTVELASFHGHLRGPIPSHCYLLSGYTYFWFNSSHRSRFQGQLSVYVGGDNRESQTGKRYSLRTDCFRMGKLVCQQVRLIFYYLATKSTPDLSLSFSKALSICSVKERITHASSTVTLTVLCR